MLGEREPVLYEEYARKLLALLVLEGAQASELQRPSLGSDSGLYIESSYYPHIYICLYTVMSALWGEELFEPAAVSRNTVHGVCKTVFSAPYARLGRRSKRTLRASSG